MFILLNLLLCNQMSLKILQILEARRWKCSSIVLPFVSIRRSKTICRSWGFLSWPQPKVKAKVLGFIKTSFAFGSLLASRIDNKKASMSIEELQRYYYAYLWEVYIYYSTDYKQKDRMRVRFTDQKIRFYSKISCWHYQKSKQTLQRKGLSRRVGWGCKRGVLETRVYRRKYG